MEIKKNIRLMIVSLFVSLSIFTPLLAQEKPLSLFNDLVGKQWKGHYVNAKDSAIEHLIRWEYVLDSKYVKQTKEVPELNFKMETFYYWDFELNQLSALTLINRNMIAKGRIISKDKMIESYSKTFKQSGATESKQTFNINASGQLEDYYFRKESEQWVQGHFILYSH